MGSYNPENPELSFSYEIRDKEILRSLAIVGYDWYLKSKKYTEYPHYHEDIASNYKDFFDTLNELTPESIEDDGFYELFEENEFFSSDLWNVVPFTIDIIEYELYPFLTPHYDTPVNFRDELSFSLQFGENISQLISEHTINFNNPDSCNRYSKFLKFIDIAGLNHIKKEFSWRFLHSSWN